MHQRGRASRLETHHSRQFAAHAGVSVFLESHPVGADVARIAHGDAEPIGGITQFIHHLKGRRFLAFQAIGVEGIHQGDRVLIGHLAHDAQGPVKVAAHSQHLGAIEQGLRQFPLGHIAIGDQHKGPHSAAAGIGSRGR